MFNKQKSYFKRKNEGVQSMMWDLEFKRNKTQMIREEVRQEYDKNKARLDVLQTQIKAQKDKPSMEEGDIKRLDDQEVLLKRDIERYESQMRSMDLDIAGSKPTNEYPDGVIGINDQLDSLRELKQMIEQYIRQL